MKPKLKENPGEWIKFTFATSVAACLVSALLWKRGRLSGTSVLWVLGVLATLDVICLFFPRWFRWFYRIGMTVFFYIGQVIGRVLLSIFFLCVLTPFGLGLRLLGKDFLKMRKASRSTSYWEPAKPSESLERLF